MNRRAQSSRDTGGGGAGRADARRNRVRILEAAGAMFAEQGASASTEAVAARAGVAIGTVFRHFPTKSDLISAVVMNVWDQLVAQVDDLVSDSDDPAALFAFCASAMTLSAENGPIFARLAETGTRVHVGDALMRLRPRVDVLLRRAREAGAVRDDLHSEELIALLGALCQEAMASRWSEPQRHRALTILIEGIGLASSSAGSSPD